LTTGLAKDLNRRVLVVDDQTTSCEVLTEMLCHWGCEVVTADNGTEGLMSFKTAAEEGYPFSIVITDTHVPGMDGYELATKIAEFSASIGLIIDTPVLMVGEIQRSEIFSNAREITGVELLNKPVTMSKLLNTLSNLGVISMVKDERDSRDWRDLEDILQSKLEAKSQRARILLVEDNETNQMVVKELLSKFALDIECAENGLVGVKKVRENEYDLVLMDLQMPKMDGFQATEAIRETKSKDELPILALSAASFMEDINKAILSGMNEHLMKPIDISQLYKALIKWLFPSTTDGARDPVALDGNNNVMEETKVNGSSNQNTLLARIRSDANFDLSVTLISVLGEQGFMRLVETFTKEFNGVLADWRQSPSWDADKKRLVAHSIKGASQSIGAVVLKQLAETVELALKEGRDVNFSALMKMLEETLETLSA
jgi:CheY-like chemotaxis protein